MRKIWLCADDYAIAPAVDAAIRDLLTRGRLNATSVMAVAPSFSSEAPPLAALIAERRAAIGLHLTLTGPFRPLTAFRPLCERAFPPLAAMARLAFLRQLDKTALAREIEAQLAQFAVAFGRAPDFVDGHQHVHLFPQIREETLAAVKRAAPAAWVRQCGSALPLRILLQDFKTLALSVLSRGFRRRAAALGLKTNPAFAGVYDLDPETDFAALFPRFLEGLPEGGLVMCHPGHVDAELRGLDPLTDLRETDYRYFAGDVFPRALAAVIEVDHVLVAHADAAGRHLGAERPRFVGAVDAIERGPEVERARAERILGTTGHVAGQIRTAPEHLVGRRPVRPFALHRDFLDARPGKPRAADPNAIADSLAAVCDEVEQTLARIDDDGARPLAAGIIDDLPVEARVGSAPRPLRALGGLAARLLPGRCGLLVTCRIIRGGAHGTPAAEQELEEAAAEISLP